MVQPLPPPAERRSALAEQFSEWIPRSLHATLDHAASRFASRALVITDDRTYTYADIATQSKRIAAGLTRMGIGTGDKVAIVLANFPQYVPLKYALSRIGAVAVPINIMLKQAELEYVLKQSDSRLLVTMDIFREVDHLSVLDGICPNWKDRAGGDRLPELHHVLVFETGEGPSHDNVLTLREIEIDPFAEFTEVAPDAVCDILFTSGTTGPPKGVQLTHDMLMRTAFGSAYSRAFPDGHRILFSLPLFHVYGYVEGMLSVPFVGGAIVPRVLFDAADTLRAIERHEANDALLIPAMSLALIEVATATEYDFSAFRHALASGGKAPVRLWNQLRDVLGVEEITTGYGMTETTASTTVTRPDDPMERLLESNGRLREVGPAADPGLNGLLVEYRVVDPETGEVLASGEMGELQARGLGVTQGYYRKPDETAQAFSEDGWLRTGDLGTLDRDNYIRLLGRTKESYRCGGEQVLPSEVEDMLAKIDGVKQVHVAPYPDERMGEVGVAFVIRDRATGLLEEDIFAFAMDHLARFKVPRYILFADEEEIPLTASGRAKKFELTRLAKTRLAAS